MKQVILRITNYHKEEPVTHSYTHSSPMHDYEVDEYIANHEPTSPFSMITDIKVIEIE